MHPYTSSQAIQLERMPGPRSDERPGCFVAGTGVPVVMLHASLGSKAQWVALAERMASRFQAIALDLWGYGDNAMPAATPSFTLDDELRLVAGHIDRVVGSHARVHIVGHSYGGLVALRLAQCWGERIASLSLYEPVAFRMLDEDDADSSIVRQLSDRITHLVATGLRHEAAKVFVDFWSGDGSYASLSLPAQANMARRVAKVPLDFAAAWRWPMRPSDCRSIVAPTLTLAGTRSPGFMKRIVALLNRSLPDGRAWWFDAGHMAPVTHADRVNHLMEAFVESCSLAPPGATTTAASPGTIR